MVRQRVQVGRLALACGLALAHPAHAAKEIGLACQTQTERDPSEIIVPFGDAEHPELPAQAVKLVPGETLCLVGDRDEAGELTNLQLAQNTNASTANFIELTLERGDMTRLTVRHSSKKWLYYRAFQLVTQQDVAVPTSVLPVPADRSVFESWSPSARKLMLYGFRFGARPTRVDPIVLRPERSRRNLTGLNVSVTFGLWGGERSTHLPELNAALARDGFAPLRRVGFIGGLDMDFTVGRVRAGVAVGAGGRSTRHRTTGDELSTTQSDIAFTAGFDVLRYEPFRVFLGSGIAVGTLFVDRRDDSNVFPDAKPWDGKRAEFNVFEVPFDLGTDYLVPFGRASANEKWVLQFGMRVGWQQQLGSGGWKTDEKNGRDLVGPAIDLSGPRARLVLGIGAQNGW